MLRGFLQEMTVLVSERGSRDNALTRGNGHLRAASMLSLAVDSPLAHNGHAVRPASMGGHADPPGHRSADTRQMQNLFCESLVTQENCWASERCSSAGHTLTPCLANPPWLVAQALLQKHLLAF